MKMSMDLDQAIQEDQLQEQAEVRGVTMVIVLYWALDPDPHRQIRISPYPHSGRSPIDPDPHRQIRNQEVKKPA